MSTYWLWAEGSWSHMLWPGASLLEKVLRPVIVYLFLVLGIRPPMPREVPGEVDPMVLKINNDDTVLTLTSGGCNSLNLLLHGAGHVVSVDCNPAQSALLELKATGIRCGMHVSHVRSCCNPVYSCKR